MGALWRMAPVFMLTVRQFLAGRMARVVLALALLPTLFAVVYLIRPMGRAPYTILVETFRNLWAPTLLPIAVLLLATSAFGNELEDRTLPYLTLKPVSRARIVLEKWLAVVAVAMPVMLLGLLAVTLVAGRGPVETASRVAAPADLWPLLGAMSAATAAGVVLLSAIFLLVGLVIPRALLAGMVYIFAWESLLGRFLPGVQALSVRHAVESVFVGLLADPNVTLDGASTVRGALVTVAVVSAVALALATLRLRTMNLE